MISAVTEHLPATVWETLSPHMYLSFWSLSLYDISVPTEKYEIELKRLRERSKLLILSAPPFNIGTYVRAVWVTNMTRLFYFNLLCYSLLLHRRSSVVFLFFVMSWQSKAALFPHRHTNRQMDRRDWRPPLMTISYSLSLYPSFPLTIPLCFRPKKSSPNSFWWNQKIVNSDQRLNHWNERSNLSRWSCKNPYGVSQRPILLACDIKFWNYSGQCNAALCVG